MTVPVGTAATRLCPSRTCWRRPFFFLTLIRRLFPFVALSGFLLVALWHCQIIITVGSGGGGAGGHLREASVVYSSSSSSSPAGISASNGTAALSTSPRFFLRQKRPEPGAVTVAYVVSLIQCGDHQSNVEGMADAAAVLRHSIHLQHHGGMSSSNNSSTTTTASRYGYKMVALVHRQAESCSDGLRELGFEILVRDTPVAMDEIRSETLKKILPRAWCCGAAEYIKLYAYTLVEHELVVHVDVDFLFTKKMDDLFDLMLLDGESADGRDARERVPREWPDKPWPKVVEAAMTRDWPQVRPGRVPGHQAGFIVIRPSVEIFEQVLDTIRNTEYYAGFTRENGWGGKGYGAFVGAAAMQGLMAYFYDHVRPDSWLELNQCRWNHMGMDVYFRSQPNFARRHPQVGQCRNNMGMECEDCQVTPIEKIYSIHYTQCRKPWNCIGEGSNGDRKGDKSAIPEDSVKLEHCLVLAATWNSYRTDLERQLSNKLTYENSGRNPSQSSAVVAGGQSGDYKREIFQGHCKGYGGDNYIPIAAGSKKGRRRIQELYGITPTALTR